MTNKVILLRHGETTSDKNNPKRGLTDYGQKQIKAAGQKIKKVVGSQKTIVIAANTKRALQSAIILANGLNLPLAKIRPNLRIKNIEMLKKYFEIYPKKDLTQIYFELDKKNQLPDMVEKPDRLVSRFKKIINLTKSFPVIIIVGHAGAIETFAKYQEEYRPKTLVKKEVSYGQFITLERKSK